MAISIIGAATCSASDGTFTTITPSSALGGGADIMYVFGGAFNGSTALATLGPTSNSAVAGSSFTQLIFSSTVSSGPIFGLWRRMVRGSTNVVAFSSAYTTSAMGYGMLILRGVASTSPEDVTTVFTSGAGTAPQSPAIIPATPNSMLLSIVGQLNHSSGMTGPTGFSNVTVSATTLNATAQYTIGIATLLTASTISTAPGAWTSTASTSWFAVTVAVRAYVPPTSTALSIDPPPAMTFQPMTAQ